MVDALQEHGGKDGMQETRDILERVLWLHHRQLRPDPAAIARLGGGWVAEEALAIGVWCALAADSLEEGIVLAVNHSGDSDSTGMIAGNILGLIHGPQAIPRVWLDDLELREVITRIAVDLTDIPARYEPLNDEPEQQQIRARYPGW